LGDLPEAGFDMMRYTTGNVGGLPFF
jgi:hypothetical protein